MCWWWHTEFSHAIMCPSGICYHTSVQLYHYTMQSAAAVTWFNMTYSNAVFNVEYRSDIVPMRHPISCPPRWAIRALIEYKMSSYQYRKSHCEDKTILWPSYFHNGISYTGKMSSLYWTNRQIITGSVMKKYDCITAPHHIYIYMIHFNNHDMDDILPI